MSTKLINNGGGGSIKMTGSGGHLKMTSGGGGGGNNASVAFGWTPTGGEGILFTLANFIYSPVLTSMSSGKQTYYYADAAFSGGSIPEGVLNVTGWSSNEYGATSFDVQVFNTATSTNTPIGTDYGVVGVSEPATASIPGSMGNLIIVDPRSGGSSIGKQFIILGTDLAAGIGLP